MEDRALSLGVKMGPSNLLAFVLSVLIVGMVGALFLVTMLLMPQGIIPTLRARWRKYQATRKKQEEIQPS